MNMPFSTNKKLSEELKAVTLSIQERLNKSPFFEALTNKNLPIESYVNYLQAMAGVSGVLEREILIANHSVLNSVWKNNMLKLPGLLADLESLNSTQVEDIPLAIDAMLDTIKLIRLSRIDNPLSLIGIMYVLESSTLEGEFRKQLVQANFNFHNNEGLIYLDHYKDKKQENWEAFETRINALPLSASEFDSIIETAAFFFKKMESIFIYLFPIHNTISFYNVSTINPEAGKHNIPEDKLEIEAAFRAGITTWEEFPYYAWRYGLRGKQYTRSDSVWLVTLCELEEEVVIEQVHWLGRVLASRGMPQWLLAVHLKNLVYELEKVHPEKKHEYDKLSKASDSIHSMFNRIFKEDDRKRLISEFESQIGEEWSHRLKNIGGLLVSAVADERNGIDKALSSIETWATDENRFPKVWIESVRSIIQSAKDLVRSGV
ncbi:MAG: biliverdin-producing heme oxygenase [Leptospiraceae bacterium]|nr:biliverdin-producing heme oxygenase [Leptospiraceae bacterium]